MYTVKKLRLIVKIITIHRVLLNTFIYMFNSANYALQ